MMMIEYSAGDPSSSSISGSSGSISGSNSSSTQLITCMHVCKCTEWPSGICAHVQIYIYVHAVMYILKHACKL